MQHRADCNQREDHRNRDHAESPPDAHREVLRPEQPTGRKRLHACYQRALAGHLS